MALISNLKDAIIQLPWKAGSGIVKGDKSGYFFCAKVGDQTFLRFVPAEAESADDVTKEMGTCLRLIECEEETVSRQLLCPVWRQL
jgi:hypothetical protein